MDYEEFMKTLIFTLEFWRLGDMVARLQDTLNESDG